MNKETIKLLLEAFGYVLTPHGGTRAHVWDSDEARFVVQAYKVLEAALANQEGQSNFCPNCEALARELKVVKQEQGEPAPVAKNENGSIKWLIDDWPQNCLLYTHTTQQQRTWVGLTDREKSNLWLESRVAIPRFHTYATLVDAKLKEKNT